MTPRLALLSAILANPDDDLPRLVFADWLEENGTSDADAARVEFIRLGCKSKAKSRITPAEGKWLDANWQRLLGNTCTVDLPARERVFSLRSGRQVTARCFWTERGGDWVGDVVFEYDRGFARRVDYPHGHFYPHVWRLAATDEPLAYHRPSLRARDLDSEHRVLSLLTPDWMGVEVYARAEGFDAEAPITTVLGAGAELRNGQLVKLYQHPPTPEAAAAVFHPLVLRDLKGKSSTWLRQWAAVATAMTAIAREYVGLDPLK